jgi:hypothetical protein
MKILTKNIWNFVKNVLLLWCEGVDTSNDCNKKNILKINHEKLAYMK